MLPSEQFPRLTPENHRLTSPASVSYNCVAWAAHDTDRWWQSEGYYWPVFAPVESHGIGALIEAFASLGFKECANEQLNPEFEKIALYGSGFTYSHVARQLPTGKWTSKLG